MMKADSAPPPAQQQRQSPISTSSSSSSNTTTTTGPTPMSPYHQAQVQPPASAYSTTNNFSYYTTNGNGQPVLEVKSKYDAEFRRFGLGRASMSKFTDFYQLVERLHGLNGIQFNICYTDKDGDLLPINNDMNLARVLQVTAGILRLIIQRKGECYNTYPNGGVGSSDLSSGNNKSFGGHHQSAHPNDLTSASYRATTNLISRIKDLKDLSTTLTSSASSSASTSAAGGNPKPFLISHPEDFRPVSAIIDVDIVPDTYRRVRLHKHKSSKPLGFYIRDGRSLRVTPQGVEQVPGIFISRLMPGGLAESTGLLSVNDEVIEVNGIEVAGKTLDQVTDMMVANSSNLIITVKPTNQRYNLNRSHNSTVISTTANNSMSMGPPPPASSKLKPPPSAAAAAATPTSHQLASSSSTAASRLYNNNSNTNSSAKFSTSHQKSEAPQAPKSPPVSSSSSSQPDTANVHQAQPETASNTARYSSQNQHINDDDDDEEEIHDATGANGSYGDDDADPDNSDDKILTL